MTEPKTAEVEAAAGIMCNLDEALRMDDLVRRPECPEIVVYWQIGPSPFRGPDFVARFWQAGEFLPMIFSGDTPDATRAAARQFWSTETAKTEALKVRAAYARETRLRRVREGSA